MKVDRGRSLPGLVREIGHSLIEESNVVTVCNF